MIVAEAVRWLVLAAYLFWSWHYWRRDGGAGAHIRRTFSAGLSPRDRVVSIQILLLFVLFGVLALVGAVGWLPLRWAQQWPTLFGGGVMLAGLWGMYTSRAVLGREWTPEASARAVIVSAGPYSRVRHPIYTCVLVMYGGMALTYPGALTLAAWVWISVAYALKALEEERVLAGQPEYAAYRAQVRWRLVPFIW